MKKIRIVPLVLAASLTLTACGDKEGTASFETAQGGTTQGAAGSASAEPAGAASDPSATSAAPVTPAKARTIEVNETKSFDGERDAFTITLHRVTIQDYYVEADITLVNNTTNSLSAWYGHENGIGLFDERGRQFPFVPQAGGDYTTFSLNGGEGVDATLRFAGRASDDTSQLKLDLSDISGEGWSQIVFDIPVVG